MADHMLFLGWGQVARGREERALEVFDESMELYGRMQDDGRLESFDVALLDPHGGALEGYVELHGSAAQIAAVRDDDDFRRLQADVSMVVDHMRIVDGHVGQGVVRQLATYAGAAGKVAQHA